MSMEGRAMDTRYQILQDEHQRLQKRYQEMANNYALVALIWFCAGLAVACFAVSFWLGKLPW